MSHSLIKLVNLTKIYKSSENVAIGIQNVNLEFNSGEFVAIVGSSGSGKTTLLNVISGMDTYEEGELFLNGRSTSDFSAEDFENYRRANVAFIFQNYQLIDSYTVLENVMIELIFKGENYKTARKKAIEALAEVGLKHRLHHRATKLSGGEMQRVVIARALVSDAPILACDEATGNLDKKNSLEIMNLLKKVAKNKLILFVTHDDDLVEGNATRLIRIKDGKVESDRRLVDVKEENVSLVEPEANKFTTKIYVAMKNIIRTPKKSLFILGVFLILSLVLFSSVAFIPTTINATESYTAEYSTYTNRDDNRIVVYSNKEVSTTKDSIIFENDFNLDVAYKLATFDPLLNIYMTSKSYIKPTLDNIEIIEGREPINDDEIFLITGDILGQDYYSNVIGKQVTIGVYGKGINAPSYYTIVGFGKYTDEFAESEKYNRNSTTTNVSAYKELYNTFDFCMNPKTIKKLQTELIGLYPNVFAEKAVDDLSIHSNGDIYSFKLTKYYSDKISVHYRFKDTDFKIYFGTRELDLSKYEVEYKYSVDNSFIAEISSEMLLKIASENPYRYSVFASNSDIDSVADELISNSENNVYVLKNLKRRIVKYNIEQILQNLYYFIFLFIEIIISLFITSLITSFVLGTKKKELGILRVIGLSEKDVLHVLNLELIFMMSISIITTLLIAFLTTILPLGVDLGFLFETGWKLIVGAILLLVMAYIISFNWNKKMFKKSAREVLKVGDAI